MNSTGHVDGFCTIGCLLTPNSRKVITVRSSQSHFWNSGFIFVTAKSRDSFVFVTDHCLKANKVTDSEFDDFGDQINEIWEFLLKTT